MYTVLESCHQLYLRLQFRGVDVVMIEDGGTLRQHRTAPCGCENYTSVVRGHGPSADGITYLCEQHMIPAQNDE